MVMNDPARVSAKYKQMGRVDDDVVLNKVIWIRLSLSFIFYVDTIISWPF